MHVYKLHTLYLINMIKTVFLLNNFLHILVSNLLTSFVSASPVKNCSDVRIRYNLFYYIIMNTKYD